MDQVLLHKFGNELEMSGIVFQNGRESQTVMFPEAEMPADLPVVISRSLNKEKWEILLRQLDTLEIEGLDKTFLRKSQRQIEQTVSWNVFRRDNYSCQYCGRNDVPLTVDHIILWEQMGDSTELNLVSACKKCNKTRGSILFLDWLKHPYLLEKVNAGFSGQEAQLNKLSAMYAEAIKLPLRKTPRSR